MDEPKKCPCCGGESDCNDSGIQTRDGDPLWWVECLKCGLATTGHKTREEALATWNRRAPTIDPERHGKWVTKTCIHENADETTEMKSYVVCGECGQQPPTGWGQVNFCHKCGARMDGGKCE